MEFGWRIVVGTLIGIFGAACGSVGGVGGGGIFVPMLILIIGFDSKSAVAISKCKHIYISNDADIANYWLLIISKCQENLVQLVE